MDVLINEMERCSFTQGRMLESQPHYAEVPESRFQNKNDLSRLLDMIKATMVSIGVDMYAFAHCEIASELIKKDQSGKLVQVCADFYRRTPHAVTSAS